VEGVASGINWTRNYEDAYWLASREVIWRRRRGLCQPDFSAWFAPVILKGSCITTCTAGQWIRWSRWPTYRRRGSACCLNYHLLVITNIFIFLFFVSMITLCICQNGFFGTICPILNLYLWENLSTYVAGLETNYDALLGMKVHYSVSLYISMSHP
jgi:hypothetical protein